MRTDITLAQPMSELGQSRPSGNVRLWREADIRPGDEVRKVPIVLQNSFWRRDRIIVRGTTATSDDLTGNFGGALEDRSIGDCRSVALFAEKSLQAIFGVLQHYRRKADVCSFDIDDAEARKAKYLNRYKTRFRPLFCFAPFRLPAGPQPVRLRCLRFLFRQCQNCDLV